MQNSFQKYGKLGCNLQNIGTNIPGSMWKLVRLAACDCCLMQYFNLDLQQPFITLALGTFFAGPPIVTHCSAVLQNCWDNQTKHFHLWPTSEFELQPMEVKSLSVNSQNCLLLPLPAGCFMNSCCSTKGQREAPQFCPSPFTPLSHWSMPKCMVNYRRSL